jgi:hypothetical protein
VLVLSAPVDCVPLVASAPDQPPEAVHELALLAVQVRLVPPPLVTLVALALKLTVGAGIDELTAVTVIPKAGSATVDVPSPTLISTFAS